MHSLNPVGVSVLFLEFDMACVQQRITHLLDVEKKASSHLGCMELCQLKSVNVHVKERTVEIYFCVTALVIDRDIQTRDWTMPIKCLGC